MDSGQIATAVRTTNRWWRGSAEAWTCEDPDLLAARDSRLDYQPAPLQDLQPGGLYILRGPRRVGKSLELKRTIARLLSRGVDRQRIIHAAVDGWRARDLGGLVRVGRDQLTRGVTAPRFWFIDEVTSVVGDWPKQVKWLRDNTAWREDCVVLTGSSARRFDEATKDLAGRRGDARDPDRLLLPMGFAAFCRALGLQLPEYEGLQPRDLRSRRAEDVFTALAPHIDDMVDAWEIYLGVGGFPRAVDDQLRGGQVNRSFVEALWQVAYGDAIRGGEHFGTAQVHTLLDALAQGLASPVNVSHVAREVSVARETVHARLEDLVAAFLMWPCHRSDGGAPQLRAQSKRYFIDPLVALLAASRNPLATPPPIQKLAEQQLGVALLRQATRREPGGYPQFAQVLFHRTQSGKEVDFVGGSHAAVPIESKYSDRPWRRDAQTLRVAFGEGIVATRSILEFDGDVWAVPAPLVAAAVDPPVRPTLE